MKDVRPLDYEALFPTQPVQESQPLLHAEIAALKRHNASLLETIADKNKTIWVQVLALFLAVQALLILVLLRHQ